MTRKRNTRSNRRTSGRIASNFQEYTPKYSIRDLHEMLDIVIARGGRQKVELHLEEWLCSDVESGLQLMD
jgi:hypothetical protein